MGERTTTAAEQVPDYTARTRLDGRGYVVLGAGQGIGRQAVHALVQAGAQVLAVDVEADRAEAVAAELPGRVVPRAADVTDAAAMAGLAAAAQDDLGGRLAGVVDIVGIARYGRLLDLTDEDWTWEQDMVLRHAWLTVRCFGRVLSGAGGGALTFVSSVSGISSAPMHGAYGAAKAALMSLVRTAAVELGPAGVRVNAVAPGPVWTPRIGEKLGAEGLERLASAAPLRRVALPADVAAGLLFLSTDLAAHVTGQVLVVDGGATATSPFDR